MLTPHITVITGCMFSGKTEELIRQLKRAKIAGLNTIIFKPAKDTRNHKNISARNGNSLNAITVNSANDILIHINESHDVIGIDEGQFFEIDLIPIVVQLVRSGKSIIISGLDLDFNEKPFQTMSDLAALAYPVIKLTAVCTKCKTKEATRSQRIVDCCDREMIGDKEYEARCLQCYKHTS